MLMDREERGDRLCASRPNPPRDCPDCLPEVTCLKWRREQIYVLDSFVQILGILRLKKSTICVISKDQVEI